MFSRVFGALPCRLLIPGIGGRPIDICRDGLVCIEACPLSDAPASRLAFAADSGAGSCREINVAPPRGPIETPRIWTACSTRSESSISPTLKVCAGLPSMTIRATPWLPEFGSRGAITPMSWKRALSAASATAGTGIGDGSFPRKGVKSPGGAMVGVLTPAIAGGRATRTKDVRPQNNTLAATVAKMMTANQRAFMPRS